MLCKVKLITLKGHDLLVTKGEPISIHLGLVGPIASNTMRHQVVFVVCGLEMCSHPPLTVAKTWQESYLPRNKKTNHPKKWMVGRRCFLLGGFYLFRCYVMLVSR